MNAPLTHALEQERVAFRLNGEEVNAFAHETIIQAADRLGVAIPRLCYKPGMRPDNMTVLDRNYPLGLSISLAIVWMCVLVYLLATRLLPVRQDEVVEQQRPDDVERQPPAV